MWTVARFPKSKVTKVGVNCLIACDENGKPVTTTPFGFYQAKDPREEWPEWAQFLVPE